ncbi:MULTISPECIES: sugar-binding transcriptional regulator [unclassified Nostoc]|uniref:sugar-binding transcriptional regulator n=1 Tax=unclassified Nostoc TaxID=2593658 RepID=UPI002AD36016|nr:MULTISPECIES: sugar-binding transcriptional regulator [unclassified Nostoc]MDZ8123065.1 sugar-binding transcriptional regulator [Nostoc sp. CmiVER01]MDZ8221501.1 sugar-binding transcriptional regulator [Nostoc sp. ChiVER01]
MGQPFLEQRDASKAGLPLRARKLDLAAHAAWLYYIAGNTQEEIAAKLNVSRQAAQRLVALAVSEKLIKFRLDHPLSECIALAESLRDRFALSLCEVVPTDAGSGDTLYGIGVCAATHLEAYLMAKTPTILALSSGRTLRTMVEQIPSMNQPQHKIVSIIGNMSHSGRAGRHEVVMHLSDRVGSQAYPVPTPVVATSIEERELLQTQRSFVAVKTLAEQAKVTFVGISHIAWNAPLHQDGFINDDEVAELIELGAVGEIAGWAYSDRGVLLQEGTNSRVASVALEQPAHRLIIGVAGTVRKSEAILAALHGKLITGLITDEAAAQAILSKI